MSNTNFEAILAEEPLIEDLINNHQVNIFSQFPDCPEYSKEFLDWISPKYFEAFKAILKESIDSNKTGKLNAFLKTPSYCDAETKEEVATVLLDYIRENNKKNKVHLAELNKQIFNIDEIYNVGGFRVVTPTTTSILNNLSHPEVRTLQSHTVLLASKIVEALVNARSTSTTKLLIKQNMDNISKLRLDKSEAAYFPYIKIPPKIHVVYDNKSTWIMVFLIIICAKIIKYAFISN